MSNIEKFDFNKRFSPKRKKQFAQILLELQSRMDIKVSSRGWAYVLEGERYINKDQFDRVQDAINDLRRQGHLPVDFVAEDGEREFDCINRPSRYSMESLISSNLQWVEDGHNLYNPHYWENEDYMIQVIVEKVDVKTLFYGICEELFIPIANARGWSSIMQRAQYARRFKRAEMQGKQCVLLYCGDHDPDGLRISDTIRKNLEQVSSVTWSDGTGGYNPENLIIDRFGLEYDFIQENNLTWIDNLKTGNKTKQMDLSDPRHPNHNLPYVQEYLQKVGARKCEANALLVIPDKARQLFEDAISKYIPTSELRRRFQDLRDDAERDYDEKLDSMTLNVEGLADDDNEISVRTFIQEVGNKYN